MTLFLLCGSDGFWGPLDLIHGNLFAIKYSCGTNLSGVDRQSIFEAFPRSSAL